MRQGRTINWGLRHTFRSVERGTEGGQELRVWATDEGGSGPEARPPWSPSGTQDLALLESGGRGPQRVFPAGRSAVGGFHLQRHRLSLPLRHSP